MKEIGIDIPIGERCCSQRMYYAFTLQDTLGDCLPQFVTRLRDRRVQATYPIQFSCQTVGWPIPEITWYKDGTEIIENGRK